MLTHFMDMVTIRVPIDLWGWKKVVETRLQRSRESSTYEIAMGDVNLLTPAGTSKDRKNKLNNLDSSQKKSRDTAEKSSC
ncbi:hypothetical protein ccbrp13_21410 [Ktedonobacteria bacterium brp13]|nr:hypothetical protein ccbrp13_21410 [Ktedonobacteria bacterium brp13]